MNRLKSIWGWIIAGIVLIGSIIWAWLSRSHKTAAVATAEKIEATVEPQIAANQVRLEELQKDATANAAAIADAEAALAAEKEKLHAQYNRQGLSAEEIAQRFRRLRL